MRQTTYLGGQIISRAQYWLNKNCVEKGSNKVYCDGEYLKWSVNNSNGMAWCAAFAYEMVNEACERLGLPNYLPQSASTATMLSESKKSDKLKVDKTPMPGCIFYRQNHVGIVVAVEDDGSFIYTIEGNSSDKINGGKREMLKYSKKTYSSYQFIHAETMHGENLNLIAEINTEAVPDEMVLTPKRYEWN